MAPAAACRFISDRRCWCSAVSAQFAWASLLRFEPPSPAPTRAILPADSAFKTVEPPRRGPLAPRLPPVPPAAAAAANRRCRQPPPPQPCTPPLFTRPPRHFFYNSPDLDFLVALQAFLTVVGNFTCWAAAYRIYAAAQDAKQGAAP
jgi:hypothetical protein